MADRPSSIKLEPDELADDSAAAKNFKAYVAKFLPNERSTELAGEELKIESAIMQACPEAWTGLPMEMRLNIMRAYYHEKERLKVTLKAIKDISAFRAQHRLDIDFPPRDEDLQARQLYDKAWPSRVTSDSWDEYGHIIVFDQIRQFNIQALMTMPLDAALHFRAQDLETLFYLKSQVSLQRGHRCCKHIYVLDLEGLELKFFGSKLKQALGAFMAMAANMFPDTLWSTWIINTPLTFRVVWSAVRPMLDPIVRAKVRMFGGKSKWIPAMAEVGIPLAALPMELGGEAKSESFYEVQQRIPPKAL